MQKKIFLSGSAYHYNFRSLNLCLFIFLNPERSPQDVVPGAPHGRDPAQACGAPGQVCDGHAGTPEAGVRGSPPGAQGDHHQGSLPPEELEALIFKACGEDRTSAVLTQVNYVPVNSDFFSLFNILNTDEVIHIKNIKTNKYKMPCAKNDKSVVESQKCFIKNHRNCSKHSITIQF